MIVSTLLAAAIAVMALVAGPSSIYGGGPPGATTAAPVATPVSPSIDSTYPGGPPG
jgi:hypothetical protein